MSSDTVEKASLKALLDEATCASACARAMKCIFGTSWLLWEPQTFWIELNHMGADVPVGNRAQIMAARNLFLTGRFWYDAHIFAATCIAFNNEEPAHFGIEEAPVMYMNWTAYEVDALVREFGEEPAVPVIEGEACAYTAVQLAREGFVVPPEYLSYAEAELKKQYPDEVVALQRKVKIALAEAPKTKLLEDIAFPETAIGVQMARHAAVQVYFERRKAERLKQLIVLDC